VIPLDQRPDLALDRSNLVPSCYGCNNRRAANAKLPDGAPVERPVSASVGDRMARIFSGETA